MSIKKRHAILVDEILFKALGSLELNLFDILDIRYLSKSILFHSYEHTILVTASESLKPFIRKGSLVEIRDFLSIFATSVPSIKRHDFLDLPKATIQIGFSHTLTSLDKIFLEKTGVDLTALSKYFWSELINIPNAILLSLVIAERDSSISEKDISAIFEEFFNSMAINDFFTKKLS